MSAAPLESAPALAQAVPHVFAPPRAQARTQPARQAPTDAARSTTRCNGVSVWER